LVVILSLMFESGEQPVSGGVIPDPTEKGVLDLTNAFFACRHHDVPAPGIGIF
jgi:hypothetical protein